MGEGGGCDATNCSKTIRCIPIKFSQVGSVLKLNIRYTFVDIATNCDVIMASYLL